jgi:uncharacterized membrane protein
MAIGYAAGATIGALARTLWPRVPAVSRRAWAVLAGAGGGLAVVFLWLGAGWQQELRRLVGAEPAAWNPLFIAVLAAIVCGLLLLASRSVRLVTRRLADTLGRYSPRPVASVAAVGLVAALSYGLGPGVAFAGFLDLADRAAAQANGDTAPGVARPDSPYVSGGPGSLVPWQTLGAYGREFTAGAVPRHELAAFGEACEPNLDHCAEGEAVPPIRVYVGRDSAPTMQRRAALAVSELERTGAFDRAVLAVITTTGTGWVNPAVADSLELLHGGDTALVAMQYSYLPSWISFMADRSTAAEAATALIGAVRERLAAVPAGQRPELVVYGESLGAHGTEAAFGDLAELLAATDGALLAGPPHTNPIWQQVVDEREADSPLWRPIHQGGDAVRFAQGGADLSTADEPDLVYLQNASDPVIWWTPELLYREPEWLDGTRGPDVSGAMQWLPVVTFWQVSVDLILSTAAPYGHGHSYGENIVDGWAALVSPPGWTDADTAGLRALLAQRLRTMGE